ncbi:MAG: HisA/HisF-related TIM barrel protein [Ignavibacteriae bacterium]|nr:HisA/HisF-related TIM barrel protein [Ignavibacteriota bacterium]
MLLIFPTIEISREACIFLVRGERGSKRSYSVDPVQMAVLWRGENAKTLHVVDRDGVADGVVRHFDVLKRLVEAVDIPVQVGGGLRSYDEVKRLLDIGVYRVVIGTASVENPALVEQLIKEFGARKVAISVEARNGLVQLAGGTKPTDITPLQLTNSMKKLGVCRVLYSELNPPREELTQEYYDTLKEIATQSGVRVTAKDCAYNYRDLIRLQELEKFGVDSVVLSKPLYENNFPCQGLWRINEKELTDLGPTRRM